MGRRYKKYLALALCSALILQGQIITVSATSSDLLKPDEAIAKADDEAVAGETIVETNKNVNAPLEENGEFDNASEKASESVVAAHDSFVGEATQDAKTETEGYKDVLETEVPDGKEVFADEISKLNTAEDKLGVGASALNDADQAVKDTKDSNKITEDKIAEYNEHMDNAEDILEHGKAVEGKNHVQKVDQFTDATTDAGEVSSAYDGIITDAEKVVDDMKEVKDSADKYDASADTTGSQFNAIKKEYYEAKAVLDGLDQRLTDATKNYNEANDNYQDAVDALSKAQEEYNLALAAYNAIVDTKDKDGNVAKEGSVTTTEKKIALVKENLAKAQKALDEAKLTEQDLDIVVKSAEGQVNDAKTNLEAAKASVEQKLGEMQRVGLQGIIDLQTEIDGMEEGADKEAKKVLLQQKFVEFYLLTQNKKVENVQFVGQAQFDQITGLVVAKDLDGNEIVVEGKKYYVSGYENDGTPILEVIPSALKVTYDVKDSEENVSSESDYYSVVVNDDGTFTVVKERRVAADDDHLIIAGHEAYYTKDGKEATIPTDAVENETKKTKDDKSVLVINKGVELDDIKEGIQDAPATGTRTLSDESDKDFVKNESLTTSTTTTDPATGEKTTVVIETYEKKTVTETIAQGDSTYSYAYGNRDVVTTTEKVEFPCTQEGYEKWLEAIEEHKNDIGFKAEFFDYEVVKVFGVPVWIRPIGMKDINDMNGWDKLSYHFDIVAYYLFGSTPFTISYSKVTQESSSENKEGFLETRTDNYTVTKTENVEYYTVTTTKVEAPVYGTETTTETVRENEAQTPIMEGNVIYKTDYAYPDKNYTEELLKQKLDEANKNADTYSYPGLDRTVTNADGSTSLIKTKYVFMYVGEVYQFDSSHWTYQYYWAKVPYETEIKTTKVVDHWVTTSEIPVTSETQSRTPKETTLDPITAVCSIKFYGGDTYQYNAATEDVTKKYYTVSDNNNTWGSSADSAYQNALRDQQSAHQYLEDAQAAYDRARISYQKAQNALDAAKADVNKLKASKFTEEELRTALQRLSAAETVLSTATTNKDTAEKALGVALLEKTAAEEAVAAAKSAWELTKPSYDKAEADKKAADDARNAAGGDDDTTSTGGGDDTTFIPGTVAVTPRVILLEANDGEAVLGEVRRIATRSSEKAVTTSEAVSTDNGNSNNSEIAGVKKEETKTPVVEETKEIEETETALAATPELEEKVFAWWLLLILAAIAGVSVEEFARRKKYMAKADNSTKECKDNEKE